MNERAVNRCDDSVRAERARRAAFSKVLTARAAETEVQGWRAAAGHLPVPQLLDRVDGRGYDTLVYEDVLANGRCRYLLGDLIALADRDPAECAPLIDLLQGIADDLISCAEKTGGETALSDCVPALHLDRLREHGRLDAWYRPRAHIGTGWHHSGLPMLAELATYTLRVNGTTRQVDVPQIIDTTRRRLTPGSRWLSAITQGDPTEPNIAYPRCWLDFEHAGRNALVAELANLVWYLLAMGGWLVPRYQPSVYQRTLRLHLRPIQIPTVEHIEISTRHRHVELEYAWPMGDGRRTAITTLVNLCREQLGVACMPHGEDLMSALRPFLVMRILGVLPVTRMRPRDAMLCLVKLAESQDPTQICSISFPTPHATFRRLVRSERRDDRCDTILLWIGRLSGSQAPHRASGDS